MKRKFFLVAAVLATLAAAAQAWDEGGHLLIGEIAARRLRPEVIQKMEALLPLLDRRFNDGQPYNLVTVGVWLDDQRGLGKENPWARWHYVDAPCAGNTFIEPPPPQALWAMDQATAVLRDPQAAPHARAEALAEVIHLVGDLHQPLHTADRHDRGGNDVKITPLLADEEAGPSNLHAFWDGAYRYDARGAGVVELWTRPGRSFWPRASREPGVIAAQADLLLKEAPPAESAVATSRQPWRDWARETHALACQSGWPDEAKTANRGPVTLRPGFVHEAHRIAEQQIVNAGERLAALLNDLLGGQAK